MKTNDQPRAEFDQFAQSYDALLDDPMRQRFAQDPLHFHRRKWSVLQRLLRRAGLLTESLRWLDVGCGRGELLQVAGSHFQQAEGCDPSVQMLSSAGSFALRLQASPTELPYADHSFDLLTAVCVFHHIHGKDRQRIAAEIRRVLTPDGLFCLIEHNPWNPVTRGIVKRCPVDADAELISAPAARKLLQSSGLQHQNTHYFLYLPERFHNKAGDFELLFRAVPLGGQYALLMRKPA